MAIVAYNKDVSYPVASQQFFEENWLPAIRSQGLEILGGLDGGLYTEITPQNWQQFSWELQQVAQWAHQNLGGQMAQFVAKRTGDIVAALPTLFEDPEAKLILS